MSLGRVDRHGRQLHAAVSASWASCATSCCRRCSARAPVADAFIVAFKLPNFFRRLFAEGAFSAAFVPLFARELQGDGRDAALAFARQAHAGLLLILVPFSLLHDARHAGGDLGCWRRACADDTSIFDHGRHLRPHHLPLSACSSRSPRSMAAC